MNPWAVLASGPSLTNEDITLVNQSGINTIAVNTTWEKARFCSVIYGGDSAWWRHNEQKIDVDADRWTCSKAAKTLYGCHYRERKIKPNFNSGANAVELAVNQFNATHVIMLGFDCSVRHGIHHHGKHLKTSNPTQSRCETWKLQFKSLRKVTGHAAVWNCSRYTELKYFEQRDLKQCLKELGLI